MRIAVIADTHNRIPLHLLREIAGADEIWHLGDVTDPGTLESVYDLGKPLHVVRGNGDWNEAWPRVIDLEREGFSIRLIHIPPLMAPPTLTGFEPVTYLRGNRWKMRSLSQISRGQLYSRERFFEKPRVIMQYRCPKLAENLWKFGEPRPAPR